MPDTARINVITEQATRRIPAMLSTLWVFVLLTVIFRDIHELFRQGFLEEIMSGEVNGVEMTETTLLIAGIALAPRRPPRDAGS